MKKVKVLAILTAVMLLWQGCVDVDYDWVEEWGDRGAGNGEFDLPYGVAVGPQGYVYVTDSYNHRVQIFTSDGQYVDKWGNLGTGDGEFEYPVGIAVGPQGQVYVTDFSNNRIQKFDASGVHLLSWGKEGAGPGEFNLPYALDVDQAGYVYVADTRNNRVQKFDALGNFVWTKWAEPDNWIDAPSGIAVSPSGHVYVSEANKNCIKKFDLEGNLLFSWGGLGSGLGDFNYPVGLAIDPWGDVYVAEYKNHRLQKFTSQGRFVDILGELGSGEAEFDHPYDLATDSVGHIFVADTGNDRIQKLWFGRIYQIVPTVSYSSQTQYMWVRARVNDLAGMAVTEGEGCYLITKDGGKIKEGQLYFSSDNWSWNSESIWLKETGELRLTVVVNGQSAHLDFTAVPSSSKLSGAIISEDGIVPEGLIVGLYRAQDFISGLVNPAPVMLTTSSTEGFVFNNVSPSRYVIIAETPQGKVTSSAFWVFGQGEEAAPNLVVSSCRISVLEKLAELKETVEREMANQTVWMKEVTDLADQDLEPEEKILGIMDRYEATKWVVNFLLGQLHSELGKGGLARGTTSQVAEWIVKPTVVATYKKEISAFLSDQSILEQEGELFKMDMQSVLPKVSVSGLYPWYVDLPGEGNGQTIFGQMIEDLDWLQGEEGFAPGRHSHDLQGYNDRVLYQRAKEKLKQGMALQESNFPSPHVSFSLPRCQMVCSQTLAGLKALELGQARVFIPPAAAKEKEFLSLNLRDHREQYRRFREKFLGAKRKQKISFALSKSFLGLSLVCTGSVVGVEVAPVLQAASFGAWAFEEAQGYVEDGASEAMLSVFRLMAPKYFSNLALFPFVFSETGKFLSKEAVSPYYLSSGKNFEAKIIKIELMGSGGPLGDKLVALPQISHLMAAPVWVTEEVSAKIEAQVGQGYDPADLRVELLIENSLGVYYHSVTESVRVGSGQSHVFEVPFRGFFCGERSLERSKMEFRLWAGPFQVFSALGNFVVILPGEKTQEQAIPLAERQLADLTERLRERKVFELKVGQNIISQEYLMAGDVFACQFRAYRPLGTNVRMRVSEAGESLGYNPSLGAASFGIAGEYSGLDSNPETITISQAAGRRFLVTLELDDFIESPARVILEVWETPDRPAIMKVWPESLELVCSNSQNASLSLGISEIGCQMSLESIQLSLSELKDGQGRLLGWKLLPSPFLLKGVVLAGETEVLEIEVEAQDAQSGVFTGQINILSENAGQASVPVRLKLTQAAPRVQVARQSQSVKMVLSWEGRSGISYQVEASANLKDWSALYEISLQQDVWQSFTDEQSPNFAQRFYRLKVWQ